MAIHDGFILTISDSDDVSLASDLDSRISLSPQLPGGKRKRNSANCNGSITKTSLSRPRKRLKADPESGSANLSDKPSGKAERSDQQAETGHLNDDFEFQLEGHKTSYSSRDSEWAFAGLVTDSQNSSRDIDVDNIIARRRTLLAQGQAPKSTNAVLQNMEIGTREQEDEESDDSAGTDGPELEQQHDELLAVDAFGMSVEQGDSEEYESEVGGVDEGDSDDHLGSDARGNTTAGSRFEDIESEADSVASPRSHPDDELSRSETSADDGLPEEKPGEAARKAAFFADEESGAVTSDLGADRSSSGFQSMNLSRPIIRGLVALKFSSPTPIQSKTIPAALLGKDVVGGAVTGSGKTAAFIVPILERLLYRPKKLPTTRVVILTPTRELAMQCHAVSVKLASFTDISFALTIGGLSLKAQELELKRRPDVVIATPGRFIDHMRNSSSFAVDNVEILVLDEADRMLEDGFADELDEILRMIPKSRQTMLFSATMTDSVDKLVRLGMNRPVRLLIDAKLSTVKELVQEFVRIRSGREEKRLGYLLELVSNYHKQRAIIFFRKKADAHRTRIIFGLLGLQAGELHGGLSQEQRIHAIESFRDSKVTFLLVTDLASRGLDIKGIDTVINFEAPQSHEIYLHRVGRTARAGRNGRSCTLATEPDRKIVRQAVKSARVNGGKVISLVLDNGAVDEWSDKIANIQDEVDSILEEEREEKQLKEVEVQLKRGENMVQHEAEINNRPKRTWFESEKDKRNAKKRGAEELNGPISVNGGSELKKKNKKKLSGKQKKEREGREERAEGKTWKKGKKDRSSSAKSVPMRSVKAEKERRSAGKR